jgi:dolichol-phosphate mannosyltransferase
MGNVTTKGYAFQMEILIRAWKAGKVIVEQPIVFVDRIFGKSKLGPNEVYLYLKGVSKLFI